MNDKKQLASYLRLSDDDRDAGLGKDESSSITSQRNIISEYIKGDSALCEYEVREFCDDGYSGVNFNRPAMQSLLYEIKMNHIFCIIVKDLSRFGRNYIEVGDYLEQIFPFLGVRFISVLDGYDSQKNNGDTGGIEVGLKNLIHDQYSKDLSRKVNAVKRMQQEQGFFMGSNAPFGYRLNPDNRKNFLTDPEAASIVKYVFELALECKSTGEIARRLNKEEVITPGEYCRQKGRNRYKNKNREQVVWQAEQVRRLLINEVYIGTMVSRKEFHPRVKERVLLSEDKYLKFENTHEAIVTEETFYKARGIIKNNGMKGVSKNLRADNPLRGKVRCAYCQYNMKKEVNVKVPYYVCRINAMVPGKCPDEHIRADHLEKVVLNALNVYLDLAGEEQKEEDVKSRSKEEQLSYKISGIEKDIRIKQEAKLESYQFYKEKKIKKDEFINAKDSLSKEIDYLTEKLTQLKKELEEETEKQEIGGHYKNINKKSTGLEREMVENFIDYIEVYAGNRVEIHWRI